MTDEKDILDLDELIEPVGSYKLVGKVYHFVEIGTMGLLKQREIDKKWQHVNSIKTAKKVTPTSEETYERLIRQLIVEISDMPKDVAKNSPVDKLEKAVSCFFSFRTASQVALMVRIAQLAGKNHDEQTSENLSRVLTAFGQKPIR